MDIRLPNVGSRILIWFFKKESLNYVSITTDILIATQFGNELISHCNFSSPSKAQNNKDWIIVSGIRSNALMITYKNWYTIYTSAKSHLFESR